MNFISDIELSLLLFILYLIIRIGAKNYFDEERGKGSVLIFFFIGIIIFLFVNKEIGIIIFLISLLFLIIPEKKGKSEEL